MQKTAKEILLKIACFTKGLIKLKALKDCNIRYDIKVAEGCICRQSGDIRLYSDMISLRDITQFWNHGIPSHRGTVTRVPVATDTPHPCHNDPGYM